MEETFIYIELIWYTDLEIVNLILNWPFLQFFRFWFWNIFDLLLIIQAKLF